MLIFSLASLTACSDDKPDLGEEPPYPNAMLESFGVNLAGAEFGKIPGRYGWDYIYPSAKELDYFKSKK